MLLFLPHSSYSFAHTSSRGWWIMGKGFPGDGRGEGGSWGNEILHVEKNKTRVVVAIAAGCCISYWYDCEMGDERRCCCFFCFSFPTALVSYTTEQCYEKKRRVAARPRPRERAANFPARKSGKSGGQCGEERTRRYRLFSGCFASLYCFEWWIEKRKLVLYSVACKNVPVYWLKEGTKICRHITYGNIMKEPRLQFRELNFSRFLTAVE